MTYSIVARDPTTGAFGVAVQSHAFAVGPRVPWLDPSAGAIATQALTNVEFGPRGLELLRIGWSASDALDALVSSDPEAENRQLGIVDGSGRVAAHTGAACIRDCGHVIGDGYVVMGNLLRTPDVWPAMAAAYEASASSPFWERLLSALEAAEAAGGDVRGRQSAALVIVRDGAEPLGSVVNVRVDDHADPLVELRRLATLSEAYRLVSPAADDGVVSQAARYAAARLLAPGALEVVFWEAVRLAAEGDIGAARRELAIATEVDPTWAEAFRRVASAGLAGTDPGVSDSVTGPSERQDG